MDAGERPEGAGLPVKSGQVAADSPQTQAVEATQPTLRASYAARKNRLLVSILLVGVGACAGGIYLFYSLALSEARAQLSTVAKNHARLLEAAADSKRGTTDELLERTNAYTPVVQTLSGVNVHFEYGKLNKDLITIYAEGLETSIQQYSTEAAIAEPMRLALSGKSGTVVSQDHRGRKVLAAYEPVAGWGIGVVLKINLEEIEAPFALAATVATPIVIVTIFILQVLVLRLTNPLIRDLEGLETTSEFIATSVVEAIIPFDAAGRVHAFNSAAERMFATPGSVAVGTHLSRLLPAVIPGSTACEIVDYLAKPSLKLEGRRKDGSTFPLAHQVREGPTGPDVAATLVLSTVAAEGAAAGWVEKARKHQRLLTQMIATTAGASDSAAIFSRAVKDLADGLDLTACALWQLDPDGTRLVLRAASSPWFGTVGKSTVPAGTSSQAGYTLLSHQPLWVEDYGEETRFATPDVRPESRFSSGLSVIVPGAGADFGVLSLHSNIKQRFTTDETHLVQSVADLLGAVALRVKAEGDSHRYRAVFELSQTATAIVDCGGNVTVVNGAFEAVTGYARDEIESRNLKLLGHDPNEHWLDEAAARTLGEGKAWQGLSINRKHDGTMVPTLRTIAPIRDAGGQLTGYVVTAHPESRQATAQPLYATATARPSDAPAGARRGSPPRVEPPRSQTANGAGDEAEPPLVASDTPPRILVADDSSAARQIAVHQLESLGYEACAVTNGFDALDALERERFDLVLLDCAMPEMDGFEATAELRRREGEGEHTIVVAMTAHNLEGDRERCLDAGMDDYLGKPVSTADLGATLARWLPVVRADAEADGGRQLTKARYATSTTAEALAEAVRGGEARSAEADESDEG